MCGFYFLFQKITETVRLAECRQIFRFLRQTSRMDQWAGQIIKTHHHSKDTHSSSNNRAIGEIETTVVAAAMVAATKIFAVDETTIVAHQAMVSCLLSYKNQNLLRICAVEPVFVY